MTIDMDPNPIDYAGPAPQVWAGRSGLRLRGPVGEALYTAAMTVAWAFLAVVVLAVPLGLVVWLTGPVLVFPALVAVVLFMPVLGVAARAVRRRRAATVLAYLEQAVRLNQPLDKLLAAGAASERGRVAQRLADVRSNLECGLSVADSLSVAVPEVPTRWVGQVAFGEATGRLPQALERLVREDVRRPADPPEGRAFAAWYPPLLVAVAGLVVTLIDVFILPKFVQIFHDFGLPLPRLTLWLAGVGDWFPYVALALAVVLLTLLGLRLRDLAGDGTPSWLLAGVRDRLGWSLPVVGSMTRDRSLADLCAALADAAEQGFPLEAALDRARQLDLNAVLRRRVARWAGGLAQGLDPVAAARGAKLPRLIAGLMSTVPAADAPAALRFAARFYASRHAARRQVLAAAYLPAVTVVMGLGVATVALALFLPMRDLINHVEAFQGGR